MFQNNGCKRVALAQGIKLILFINVLSEAFTSLYLCIFIYLKYVQLLYKLFPSSLPPNYFPLTCLPPISRMPISLKIIIYFALLFLHSNMWINENINTKSCVSLSIQNKRKIIPGTLCVANYSCFVKLFILKKNLVFPFY